MRQTLSFAQLEALWIQAGGPADVAPIMARIAQLESFGGDPTALNPNDTNGQGGTQSSYGLWQISNGTHTPFSPDWANPLVNAQAAVAKYNAGGLGPWGGGTAGTSAQALADLRKGGAFLANLSPTEAKSAYSGAVATVTTGPWPMTAQRATVVVLTLLLTWFLVGAFRRS